MRETFSDNSISMNCTLTLIIFLSSFLHSFYQHHMCACINFFNNRHSNTYRMNIEMAVIRMSHLSPISLLCVPCQQNRSPYSSLFSYHLFAYTISLLECSPHLSSAYLNPVFRGQFKFYFFHET